MKKVYKFHITGYKASNDPFYYNPNHPVDITVIAQTMTEAIEKSEEVLECNIHKATMKCKIVPESCDVDDSLIIKVKDGYFRAEPFQDPNYPSIDIEFISDNDTGDALSRPRILFEKPLNGNLRALIWNNPNSEDYEEEIEFQLI